MQQTPNTILSIVFKSSNSKFSTLSFLITGKIVLKDFSKISLFSITIFSSKIVTVIISFSFKAFPISNNVSKLFPLLLKNTISLLDNLLFNFSILSFKDNSRNSIFSLSLK
ncbi:hypothetical protein KST84_01790 [Fusobacterium nucleatum]